MLNRFVFLSMFAMLALVSTDNLRAQSDTLPSFLTELQWDATVVAEAVNHFVEQGEDAAIKELKSVVASDYFSNRMDLSFRVACLCRILWEKRDEPIPPFNLGVFFEGVAFVRFDEADHQTWPIHPLAKSGNSYFLVVCGGRVGTGQTTNISKYIDRCRESGEFLEEAIPVPTLEEIAADADKLRNSERWVAEFENKSDKRLWKTIQHQFSEEASEKQDDQN